VLLKLSEVALGQFSPALISHLVPHLYRMALPIVQQLQRQAPVHRLQELQPRLSQARLLH